MSSLFPKYCSDKFKYSTNNLDILRYNYLCPCSSQEDYRKIQHEYKRKLLIEKIRIKNEAINAENNEILTVKNIAVNYVNLSGGNNFCKRTFINNHFNIFNKKSVYTPLKNLFDINNIININNNNII